VLAWCRVSVIAAEEGLYVRHNELRLFFHDPVTGLWYHQTVDMVERRCCAGLHAGAERLLATYGEHWHVQLADLREAGLIVLGVLRERGKLIEC
jgi:hypothetical protein